MTPVRGAGSVRVMGEDRDAVGVAAELRGMGELGDLCDVMGRAATFEQVRARVRGYGVESAPVREFAWLAHYEQALTIAEKRAGEAERLRGEYRHLHEQAVMMGCSLAEKLDAAESERDEARATAERVTCAAQASGADLIRIGALCSMTDDEYPLKAVERVVRERDEARAAWRDTVADTLRMRDASDTTRREWEVRAATSYAKGRAAGLREAAATVRALCLGAHTISLYDIEASLLALAPPAAETVVPRG